MFACLYLIQKPSPVHTGEMVFLFYDHTLGWEEGQKEGLVLCQKVQMEAGGVVVRRLEAAAVGQAQWEVVVVHLLYQKVVVVVLLEI